MTNPLAGNWNYPTQIRFGAGRISDLVDACKSLSMINPLFVTDKSLAKRPMIPDAMKICSSANLGVGLFSDIKPNPSGENVEQGVTAFKKGKHDGIIAMGGGSSLDAGKAIALMVGQNRSIWDFEDVGDNWARVDVTGIAPVIAIPTTAGTGSEVGRASVIHDVDAVLKKIIFHPTMMPEIVIADPELTIGLSPNMTAATGMDALSHNLEALCAPGFHPMADGIAMEAIRLIKENLPLAIEDGTNLDARSNMLVTSMMGATAFQKGLGGMHALAHPLGAVYDAHHGLLNAILMPYVLEHNRNVIEATLTRLANHLGLSSPSSQAVIDWVLQLRKEIDIPHQLSEIGIEKSSINEIATMAVQDPSNGGNPIPMDIAQYQSILEKAI